MVAAGASSGGKRARSGSPPPRSRGPPAPRAARRQEQPAPALERQLRHKRWQHEQGRDAQNKQESSISAQGAPRRRRGALGARRPDELEGSPAEGEEEEEEAPRAGRCKSGSTTLSSRALQAVESDEDEDEDEDEDDAEECDKDEDEGEMGGYERPVAPGHGPARANANMTPLSTRAVRDVEFEEDDDVDDEDDDGDDGAEEGEEEEEEEQGEEEEDDAETRSPGRGGNAVSRSAMTPLSTRAVRSGDSDGEGVLEADKVAGMGGKVKRRGVVYISRPPLFMKPAKVRLLLGQHGAVTNLYLAPEDASIRKSRFKRGGSRKVKFTEGWVEFESRAAAKHVAGLLHGQRIGGKRGNFHYDDLWSLKYLSGFQWSHLSEKAAYERRVKSVRLRAELASAKRENEYYLEKVAQSKRIKAIVSKKQQRGRALAPEEEGPKRQFKQLESQEAYSKAKRARLGGGETVLDNVFT
jgi:ESF2/ABP1 family protein